MAKTLKQLKKELAMRERKKRRKEQIKETKKKIRRIKYGKLTKAGETVGRGIYKGTVALGKAAIKYKSTMMKRPKKKKKYYQPYRQFSRMGL